MMMAGGYPFKKSYGNVYQTLHDDFEARLEKWGDDWHITIYYKNGQSIGGFLERVQDVDLADRDAVLKAMAPGFNPKRIAWIKYSGVRGRNYVEYHGRYKVFKAEAELDKDGWVEIDYVPYNRGVALVYVPPEGAPILERRDLKNVDAEYWRHFMFFKDRFYLGDEEEKADFYITSTSDSFWGAAFGPYLVLQDFYWYYVVGLDPKRPRESAGDFVWDIGWGWTDYWPHKEISMEYAQFLIELGDKNVISSELLL
jgi:hypothetical protein